MTDVIRRTRDTAALNLDAHGTPPLTAPTGSGTTVFMHYRGRIGDMLTLAHEFGHALQITQTGGTFVSPIAREICAFLAELALLAKLARDDPALGAMALDAWHVDNGSYLGKHAAALDRALTDPGSQYVYGWNYPIARVLASEAAGQLPVETRWSVFENRVSVSGLATFLGCFRRASPTCTGACLNYSGKLKHTE